MSDSNTPEHLGGKHVRDPEQRIEGIKRWVDCITSEPVETWGPQQNTIVNGQLDAAQSVRTSASHKQRVRNVADAILDVRRDADGDSESVD